MSRMRFAEHYGYLPKFDETKKRDKLTLSHWCGDDKCIKIQHLIIQSFSDNRKRKEHHHKLHSLKQSKISKEGSKQKYKTIYYLDGNKVDIGCDCNPICFISIKERT